MKSKYRVLIALVSANALIVSGAYSVQSFMTSRIEARIKNELPNASGISVSIPLADIPHNLSSDSINSAKIIIGSYVFKGIKADSAIAITVKDISKSQPTIVGSLDLRATIPTATIVKTAKFENAQIVGNTLQFSFGVGGLGQAKLIPKFTNNAIYFQLQSVSIFGNEFPAASLPADVQSQIKIRSIRELNVPKGLNLKSVNLSSKGLSINLRGSKIQIGKLGSLLKPI